jgi:ribonuclease HI
MTLLQPSAPTAVIIHTDGGSRGNPGPAATGIVIYDAAGLVIDSFGEYLGIGTNNEAEYTAVIHALNRIINTYSPPPKINFKLDSKLVVEQLSKNWKIKEPRLQALADAIWQLINQHHLQVKFSFIPRAQNAAADYQVNVALDRQLHG